MKSNKTTVTDSMSSHKVCKFSQLHQDKSNNQQ